MIRLKKRPKVPAKLEDAATASLYLKLSSMIDEGISPCGPDFTSSVWRHHTVKGKLYKYQQKKCCYCERKRDEKGDFDVEHFRPKSEVKHESEIGYWWLAYNWENLFLACKSCNSSKSSKFPLVSSYRATKPADALDQENYAFLSPENDDIEDVLTWNISPKTKQVQIVGVSKRARTTVKELNLGNSSISEERAEILPELASIAFGMEKALRKDKQVKFWKKEIFNATSSALQFTAFRRYFFSLRGFEDFICKD